MRRLLVAGSLLALLATAAQAGDGLARRSSHEAPFSVKVPRDWRYRDATYPSDHSTELWRDRHDKRAMLRVEVSACVGCVEPTSCVLRGVGCGPAPGQVVPVGTTSRTRLDRYRLRFLARTDGNPYPDRGLVAILHDGTDIQGFALVQVWLPPSMAPLANAILGSFRLG